MLTCHRAQGCDFGRVVVVHDDRSDRNRFYTAVTRGRCQGVLVGTRAQVERNMATKPRVKQRRVGLDALLSRYIPVFAEERRG